MLAKAKARMVSDGRCCSSIKQAYANETTFWIRSPKRRLGVDSRLKVLYGI